jgi:hypothetical protein
VPPLTIIHASGFYLGEAIAGVSELPPRLVGRLIEAPRKTLLRVAETAGRERAHAVIFVGDVLHPATAAPGDWFTVFELCERLAAQRVPLIWLWGQLEHRGPWPEEFPFPPNVHIFRGDEACVSTVPTATGSLQVTILPQAAPGKIRPENLPTAGGFTIGLAYGQEYGEGQNGPICDLETDYWAAGGRCVRREFDWAGVKVHDPGPAFVHSPDMESIPAITIVELHAPKKVYLRSISLAALRWHTLTLYVAPDSTEPQLVSQIIQEAEARRAAGDADWLVRIRLEGLPQVLLPWRIKGFDREILELLRMRYGQSPPYFWPIEITWHPSDPWPESWLQEESFRGELLRQGLTLEGTNPSELVSQWLPESELELPQTYGGWSDRLEATWPEIVREALFYGLMLLEENQPAPRSGGGRAE